MNALNNLIKEVLEVGMTVTQVAEVHDNYKGCIIQTDTGCIRCEELVVAPDGLWTGKWIVRVKGSVLGIFSSRRDALNLASNIMEDKTDISVSRDGISCYEWLIM